MPELQSGSHLAAARQYVFDHKVPANAPSTIGSDDRISLSMRQLDELAQVAVNAAENEELKNLREENEKLRKLALTMNSKLEEIDFEAHREILEKYFGLFMEIKSKTEVN